MDPTQKMVVDMVKEWAEKRFEWKSLLVVADHCHPLPLRMLVIII